MKSNHDLAFQAVLAGALLLLRAVPSFCAQDPIILNDDGGWSWFEDERAIVAGDQIIVGSVAQGRHDRARRGHVEVASYDCVTGETRRAVLHEGLEADDHDSPAFWERPDQRILAVYSKHGPENRIYYRVTERPRDIRDWEPEQVFTPSPASRVTYSNVHWLSEERNGAGRLYNFFRGYEATFKPSWMHSEDQGKTWRAGGVLIDFPGAVRHRPYVKYASNGRDTIHFCFTEGHPRNYDNSVYHAYYRDGSFHRSNGTAIQPLAAGPILPAQTTRVFSGDANNVAWTHDIALDTEGRPRMVYSVQKDSAGLPPKQGGQDHRYRYAIWTGHAWADAEIARAGPRLYPGEDDYTGGICLDPETPDAVFLSSSVHPASGEALAGGHYEIFQGTVTGPDRKWTWTALTPGATSDQLRPIRPAGRVNGRAPLLWLRGRYRSYTDYDLEVVLQLQPANS